VRRATQLALGATAAAIVVGVVVQARFIAPSHATERPFAPTSAPARVLHVPHAAGPVVLDGDMDDPGWIKASARTNAFVTSDDEPARPYSDARFVWGDGHLYVALYAADEDIRATRTATDDALWLEDAFHLVFASGDTERAIDVSPLGTITDGRRTGRGAFDYTWQSGAHVSHEADGTANDPHDDDEEWVIEMAIPFESLGLEGEPGETVGFSVHRCDTPKRSRRVCASWGEGATRGVLMLD
jgi:hypothetical protein